MKKVLTNEEILERVAEIKGKYRYGNKLSANDTKFIINNIISIKPEWMSDEMFEENIVDIDNIYFDIRCKNEQVVPCFNVNTKSGKNYDVNIQQHICNRMIFGNDVFRWNSSIECENYASNIFGVFFDRNNKVYHYMGKNGSVVDLKKDAKTYKNAYNGFRMIGIVAEKYGYVPVIFNGDKLSSNYMGLCGKLFKSDDDMRSVLCGAKLFVHDEDRFYKYDENSVAVIKDERLEESIKNILKYKELNFNLESILSKNTNKFGMTEKDSSEIFWNIKNERAFNKCWIGGHNCTLSDIGVNPITYSNYLQLYYGAPSMLHIVCGLAANENGVVKYRQFNAGCVFTLNKDIEDILNEMTDYIKLFTSENVYDFNKKANAMFNDAKPATIKDYVDYTGDDYPKDVIWKQMGGEFKDYNISNYGHIVPIDGNGKKPIYKKYGDGKVYVELEKTKHLLKNLVFMAFDDDLLPNRIVMHIDGNDDNFNANNLVQVKMNSPVYKKLIGNKKKYKNIV